MRILFKYLIFLSLTSCAFGPLGLSKKAIKKLSEQDYAKADQLVLKALEKDSLLPAALYAKSKLMIAYDSHEFYDSAYFYILTAQSILDTLNSKSKEKHIKQGFDSVALAHHKTLIDSLAFQWTQRVNTEDGYNEFLKKYPTAKHVVLAKTKRNALAFASAKDENTYQSYKLFMEKYPDAVQVREARNRYEKLYFDKSTADGRVMSFIRFLEKHPETPYRKEAERNIFEVMTSEHSVGGYELFLRNYPNSYLRKKAIDFAYHVAKHSGVKLNARYFNDSLRHVQKLEDVELFAHLEEGKFGFINRSGETIIQPKFQTISHTYKCSSINTDYLLVDDRLEGRNGAVILKNQPNEVRDLGFGLLKIGSENNWRIVHKSGSPIRANAFDEVKLLGGNMLALKRKNVWRVETISGRLLIADDFDDVYEIDGFIIFEKDELFEIKTAKQLLQAVDNTPVKFEYIFSDYEVLPDGNMWVASNYGEMIANSQLEEIIPYANQRILPIQGGLLVEQQARARIYDQSYQLIYDNLGKLRYNESWLIDIQDTAVWMLDLNDHTVSTMQYDSAQLLGKHFLQVFEGDSIHTFFKDGLRVTFNMSERFNVLTSEETEYLKVIREREMLVYNAYGELLIDDKPLDISVLAKEALIFSEKNKKGLIDGKTGDVLLRASYDAIGNYKDGNVSILKDKKFGLYDLKRKIFIKPDYDKNIISYNDSLFIVSKTGKYHFADRFNTLFTTDGFDAIAYWSDTLAMVRQATEWSFFNIKTKSVIGAPFKSYQVQTLPSGEKLAIVLGEQGYGVYSDRRGEVVSPTYNDIVILPSEGEPLIFTEKHIKEAAFFVVIYYDLNGEALLKKAYESQQYDRIYCDQ